MQRVVERKSTLFMEPLTTLQRQSFFYCFPLVLELGVVWSLFVRLSGFNICCYPLVEYGDHLLWGPGIRGRGLQYFVKNCNIVKFNSCATRCRLLPPFAAFCLRFTAFEIKALMAYSEGKSSLSRYLVRRRSSSIALLAFFSTVRLLFIKPNL